MEHLFYFGSVLFAIYELMYLVSVRSHVQEKIKYYLWSRDNKGVKYDEMPKDIKDFAKRQIIGVPLIVWTFVGLMSSQWVVFGLFLMTQLLLGIVKKPFKYNLQVSVFIDYINTIIGLLFALFVIINKYHLRIDLLYYVKSLF
jgi:hypothetical protein